MTMRTVTMYRVECDADGCTASPQDDYVAWTEADHAIEIAEDAFWTIRGERHWCDQHTPAVCMGAEEACARTDTIRGEDGWLYCEDHIAEGTFEDQPAEPGRARTERGTASGVVSSIVVVLGLIVGMRLALGTDPIEWLDVAADYLVDLIRDLVADDGRGGR